MTEFEKLVSAGQFAHTIEVVEIKTGKCGVANICDGSVQVFYGDNDGSDDAIVSAAEFNKRFTITAVIPDNACSFTAFAYDDGVTTVDMATYDNAEDAIAYAKSHNLDEVVNDISGEVVYRR